MQAIWRFFGSYVHGFSDEEAAEVQELIRLADDLPEWKTQMLEYAARAQGSPAQLLWAIREAERPENQQDTATVVLAAMHEGGPWYFDEYASVKAYLSDAVARIAFLKRESLAADLLLAYQSGAYLSEYTLVEVFRRGGEEARKDMLDDLEEVLQRKVEWKEPDGLLPYIREIRARPLEGYDAPLATQPQSGNGPN